jgi:hypothetical protein
MEWTRILACITGSVDRELLLRNEYLSAENRIVGAQVKGRLALSDTERAKLADIGFRLGRKALAEAATATGQHPGVVPTTRHLQIRQSAGPSSAGPTTDRPRGRERLSLIYVKARALDHFCN